MWNRIFQHLNYISIGGFPRVLVCQQGSIFIFVLLILIYCVLLNRMDRKHHQELEVLKTTREGDFQSWCNRLDLFDCWYYFFFYLFIAWISRVRDTGVLCSRTWCSINCKRDGDCGGLDERSSFISWRDSSPPWGMPEESI